MSQEQINVNDLMDIPSVLKHWSETVPDKEAFVFFNENGRTSVLTCRDVYVLAGRFASRLKRMGFQDGDLISNAIPNSPERVVTDFGVMMAGCIGSNCQIMEKDGSDLWYALQTYKSAGIILLNEENNAAFSIFKQHLPLHGCGQSHNQSLSLSTDLSIPQTPNLKRAILINRNDHEPDSENLSFLDSLRQSSKDDYIQETISPQAIAFVFGTSGTTGFSKLSPRTHEVILAMGRSFEQKPSIRLNLRPLGWMGGFSFVYLANSSTTVVQDCFKVKTKLSAAQLWRAVEAERCASAFILPQDIDPIIGHFKENPPEYKLQFVVTGGQPLTKKVCAVLGVITNVLILTYASTEMGGITNSVITNPDQMEDYLAGPTLPGVSIKIVDDKLDEVKTGEKGMIVVKTPFGCSYYYNQSSDKVTCTPDGYFITRDRGWINEKGVLYVTDRCDDVMFQGAILVYPSWPESVLAKIDGVREALVFGVPQSDGADKIFACVAVNRGSNLTKESVMAAYTDSFLVTGDEFFPKLSHVEIVTSFPLNENGKIHKRKLREMAKERFL